MLVCEQQIETRVSSKTSMNSRAIIYSMKRRKKKEVSIACIHIQTCKHTQYAYNNAHTRRLMFIDITIIFVKQCITNWKSLDIFTFYLSGFWREFFFRRRRIFSYKINSFFILFVLFLFRHSCFTRNSHMIAGSGEKKTHHAHTKNICAPHWMNWCEKEWEIALIYLIGHLSYSRFDFILSM